MGPCLIKILIIVVKMYFASDIAYLRRHENGPISSVRSSIHDYTLSFKGSTKHFKMTFV